MRAGLVEADGQLALVNLNWDEDDPAMEIWIMEVEEKESMVWKKQYVIHFPIQLERWFKKTNFFFATNHAGEIAVLVMMGAWNGKIIAFDFKTENFPEIPPPPPTIMKPRFIEMDHRLAIVDLISDPFDPNLHMKIWRLEESMVWEAQYYLIPIPISLEERKCECFSKANLAFATNHVGEIGVLVSFCTSLSILFYNFITESWRRFDICELPLYRCAQRRVNMNFILDNVFYF
nr:putative F-box protein At3g52320 [Ipomoea batatas]